MICINIIFILSFEKNLLIVQNETIESKKTIVSNEFCEFLLNKILKSIDQLFSSGLFAFNVNYFFFKYLTMDL